MSEAKSSKKKAPKAKTETAPKAESKSESAAPEGAAPKAADSADSKPSTEAASSDTKSSDSAKDGAKESGKDGGKEGGKSARESAGGKSDVHYGYFSSVRTPEYRSGWDAIWGGKNGDNAVGGDNDDETPRRRAAARTSRPAKSRKRRDPVTVTLDLDDLPPELRQGLVEIASARLKESRVSYARRDKAGAIDWRITCRAE